MKELQELLLLLGSRNLNPNEVLFVLFIDEMEQCSWKQLCQLLLDMDGDIESSIAIGFTENCGGQMALYDEETGRWACDDTVTETSEGRKMTFGELLIQLEK